MIVDDQTDAFNNRMREFEEKLAQVEQAMLALCSRTEEKIDRVLVTLNTIHDRIMQQHDENHDDDIEIYSDVETDSDNDKEIESEGGSDYETASVDLSDEADR